MPTKKNTDPEKLLANLTALREDHEPPEVSVDDGEPEEAQAAALHFDALAHVDAGIDAIQRSIATRRKPGR